MHVPQKHKTLHGRSLTEVEINLIAVALEKAQRFFSFGKMDEATKTALRSAQNLARQGARFVAAAPVEAVLKRSSMTPAYKTALREFNTALMDALEFAERDLLPLAIEASEALFLL